MTEKGAGERKPSNMDEFKAILADTLIPVHVPNIIHSMCQGVVTPVVPIFARSLGATDGTVGIIIAAFGLGKLSLAVPGGIMTQSEGVRRMMAAGMLLTLLGTVLGILSTTPLLLGFASLSWGASVGLYFIARHPFLAAVVEKSRRGRLMSFVGGGVRWAMVFGPAIGGFLTEKYGARWAFAAQVPLVMLATACVWLSPTVLRVDAAVAANEESGRKAREVAATESSSSENEPSQWGHVMIILRSHGKQLAILGVFASSILGLRSCRRMMLPLVALNMGMSPTKVGLIVSVSFVVDASLFWVGGTVMDRFGRKKASVPTSSLLGIAFLLLAATTTIHGLVSAALFFGLSECMGSGILLTMIADNTPPDAGVAFMGFLRMMQDCGQLLWPLLAGFVAQGGSIQHACIMMGVLGLLNSAWAWFMIPETHAKKKPHSPPANEQGDDGCKSPSNLVVVSVMDTEELRSSDEVEEELRLSFAAGNADL